MIFTTPKPFDEAIKFLEGKNIFPTTASTSELQALAPQIRERAFFSARTTNADYLQKVSNLITRITSPEVIRDPATGEQRPVQPGEHMDPATARLEMKRALASLGYQPDPQKRGGLQDLSSDMRINLVIKTDTELTQGFAAFEQ
jgi:hypothetical protein